jgi:hypothetical protein
MLRITDEEMTHMEASEYPEAIGDGGSGECT